jgi:hypothetical protein
MTKYTLVKERLVIDNQPIVEKYESVLNLKAIAKAGGAEK